MKTECRKLSLRRETLMSMNDEELVNINGGTVVASAKAVSRATIAASKWSSKECAFGAVWDTAMRSIQYSLDRLKSH